jgi:hypothetical protein
MRRRRIFAPAALAAAALALLFVPLAASGGDGGRVYLGISLHFTGPTSSAGTFVMSGVLEDSGASTVENIAIVPIGKSDRARLSGDQQYVGQKGTIFTHFEGIAFPLSSPHQVGKGRITFLDGTGAYAGLRGHATFLIVVDAISNQLMGTVSGTVNRGGDDDDDDD